MKRVQQRDPRGPIGDCFAACVASILEVDLEDIPKPRRKDFISTLTWEGYLNRINQTVLQGRQMYLGVMPALLNGREYRPNGYAILVCGVAGSERNHSVVTYHGEIVWDPNPEAKHEYPERHYYMALVPYNPVAKDYYATSALEVGTTGSGSGD